MTDIDSAAIAAIDKLASVVVQLDMTAQQFGEVADRLAREIDTPQASASSGNIVINAGGIANAVALVMAVSSMVVVGLFSVWVELQQSTLKDTQDAWLSVIQRQMADLKATQERAK